MFIYSIYNIKYNNTMLLKKEKNVIFTYILVENHNYFPLLINGSNQIPQSPPGPSPRQYPITRI